MNKMSKKEKNKLIKEKRRLLFQAGFTLAEMLVIMFIISLLSTLILANYRGGQRQYALNDATKKLLSDLRKAQNMAISGSGNSKGYGISAVSSSTSYIIFGDNNGNFRYESGTDVVLETISLPLGIKILSVSPLLGGRLSVVFAPPAPTTFINAQSTLGLSATFTLQTDDGSLTKTITTTTAGLINSD